MNSTRREEIEENCRLAHYLSLATLYLARHEGLPMRGNTETGSSVNIGTFLCKKSKIHGKNPVCQAIDLCIEIALKLTYEHLELKKISRGLRPLDPRE
jgi:hypothetical protein